MQSVVLGAKLDVHQRAIRLRQCGGSRRGHLLKFAAEMLNLVGMVSGDLGSEGPFDFLSRRGGLDGEELVEVLHFVYRAP